MSTNGTVSTEISKAVEQMALMSRTYGLNHFKTRKEKDDWKHDLSVMRAHGDLKHLRLELLDAKDKVVAELTIQFQGAGQRCRLADSGRGLEMPVLDRDSVAGSRLLIRQSGKEELYRHLLRMSWSPAGERARSRGSTYAGEHCGAITGGSSQGRFFVSDTSRHRGTILRVVRDRGYAFARDTRTGTDVFLHFKFAPGVRLKVGQRVSYLLVQTPRGLQARSVQAA